MGPSRNVIILGGGVSGLSCAYHLNLFKNQILTVKGSTLPKITILEKSNEIGGWMKSYKDEETGAVFELGPRSLRASGTEAKSSLAWAEELGLSDQVIHCKRTSPAGILGLLKTQPPLTKPIISYAFNELFVKPPPDVKNVDESIHSFMSRRFGLEMADYLFDPFFRGVIAGDIRTTSIKAFLPRFKAVEDEYGSVLRNFRKLAEPTTDVVKESVLCRKALDDKWSIWSLKSGLGVLPKTAYEHLISENVDIKLNSPCIKLEHNGKTFQVHTKDECLEADLVVASINSKSLAQLLPNFEKLSNLLSSLPSVDVATATLEYPISSKNIPQAFGHLIPSGEPEPNLGVIYESVVFPELDREDKSTTKLTCMIGGAWFDKVLGSNATISQVEDIAMKSIAKQLNIKEAPVNIRANIIRDAIPQYPVGHGEVVTAILNEIQENGLPLCILGPSYDRPGANHCIHLAKIQARVILEKWDSLDYMASLSSKGFSAPTTE